MRKRAFEETGSGSGSGSSEGRIFSSMLKGQTQPAAADGGVSDAPLLPTRDAGSSLSGVLGAERLPVLSGVLGEPRFSGVPISARPVL